MDSHDRDQQALQREIADLERRLRHAKSQLTSPPSPSPSSDSSTLSDAPRALTPPPSSPPSDAALHTLLLLADSALPLGSFAFSSGLESYLAHHRPATSSASQVPAFHHFLRVSLHTLASTALPYVLAGYRAPHLIADLDNDFDASTPCTVARRASVAQGRALLAIWDRSFKASYHQAASPSSSVADVDDAIAALARFQAALRASTSATPLPPNAHLAPLWGLLTRILGVELHEAAYLFLFSHARTVTSAAVRASVLGPYQAQAVLADARLRERVSALVREHWDTPVEEAGQVVPVVDLWVGRHEKLYSRIFNS